MHQLHARGDDSSDDDDERGGPGSPSQKARTLSQIKRGRVNLQKRYVFLCPTAMDKHFSVLPHEVKYAALLVFRCSRSWLLGGGGSDPPLREDRNAATTFLMLTEGVPRPREGTHFATVLSREFRSWVQTKDKEGCVFWCKPVLDFELLSAFFEEKQDPVLEQPYRPMLLDPVWWRQRFRRGGARFCANPAQIVTAFNAAQHANLDPRDQGADLLALQELIYQSNPTLEPVVKWPHAPSMRFLPRGGHKDIQFGQKETHRGFMDYNGTSSYKVSSPSGFRIKKWPPTKPQDRLDNLSGTWAVEDEKQSRRTMLAARGAKLLRDGALTAR